MTYDIRIDISDLFNECMDQTLIDLRDRPVDAGQNLAMDRTVEDIFTVHLRGVADAVAMGIKSLSQIYHFSRWGVLYRMSHTDVVPIDIIGNTIKECLKYGMLCWWYKSRDVALFQHYQTAHNCAYSQLRSYTLSTHTSRPYRLY